MGHTDSFDSSAPVARSEEPSNMLLPALIAKFEQAANRGLSDAEPATFSSAIAKIVAIKQTYLQNRHAWIEARQMIPILLGLGATEEDIAKLGNVSGTLESDPTLPFRKTRTEKFSLDLVTNLIRRLEPQPFVLNGTEDFNRHDSGQHRWFKECGDDIHYNTAFQALLIFKWLVVGGVETLPRPGLNYESPTSVCTMFHVRTLTTPTMLGEPALEGVHTDGVDHTMTTFLGAENMGPKSAATYLHAKDERGGIPLHETSPEKILGRVRHVKLLDTLLLADYELKHSATALHPLDPAKDATRDMLVFFTRKPYNEAHYAAGADSLLPHPDYPVKIPVDIIEHSKRST
ncbi:2OG-Fe dioxygenase family protein [Microdochium nivale]|nr:2OG-Fe dioxygenase family protein [Microdochium nivale]